MFSQALRRGRPAAIACALLASASAELVPPADAGVRVDLGGGGLTPFRRANRSAYGTSPVVTGGVSVGFTSGTGQAFLEVGYVEATGSEIPRDPTFERGDSTYRLVPVSIGLRGDLAGGAQDRAFHVLVGAGWQTVFTRRDTPDTAPRSTPTIGGFFELQPEVRIDARWSVWLRQRLVILDDARYDTPSDDINYGGSLLQVGLGFGRAATASPPGSAGDS